MGKIFDEVNEKVFNTNTEYEDLQGLCIDLATKLEKAEQQGLSAGNAGYKEPAEELATTLWNKLLDWIKDDIEFGYSSSMIYNKIITNCYDITHTDEMKHLQKP